MSMLASNIYEQQYRARAVQNLKRKAQARGFQLLPTQACNTTT
jgi:hypothetical protein